MLNRCFLIDGFGDVPVVLHDAQLVQRLCAAVNSDELTLIEPREAWDYTPDGGTAARGGRCWVIGRLDNPPLILHDETVVKSLMDALNTENLKIIEPREAWDHDPTARTPARSAWTGEADDGR